MGGFSDLERAFGVDVHKSVITGETGMEAASEAAKLQADAITESARIAAASQADIQRFVEEQAALTTGRFDPFLAAGTGALPGVQQASTIGGLDERISQIMGGDAFAGLVDERTRSVQGMLGAGGLTRSGAAITEGARIPTDIAFQIENLLAGRESSLAQGGLSAAAQTAGADAGFTDQSIAAMMGGTQALTSGITGAAQAAASGILGGAQAQAASSQNLMNLGGAIGGALLSDPRLKENIVKIGEIGGLGIYEWDYIEEIRDSKLALMKSGFMADEVKKVYPGHVVEFGGYDLINYNTLLDEMQPLIN